MAQYILISSLVFVVILFPGMSFAQSLSLDYSTYLGGSEFEAGKGISLGTDGQAFVTGWTSSFNFPTRDSYQAWSDGGNDVFVTALSSTGSAILYSSYIGGSKFEYGYGISVGTNRRIYITGSTNSTDFPMKNPYQAIHAGETDVFVVAFLSTGSDLYYSTFLGGSGNDEGQEISMKSDGTVYISGKTFSSDFPTENPYQASKGGDYDAFITALSSSGSNLAYSTYLGGSNEDYSSEITLRTDGTAYVIGQTYSSNFPVVNPYQMVYGGGGDSFVSAITSSGSALYYSTYLGGDDDDRGCGIRVGPEGTAFVTGWAASFNFPTKNPYQATNGYTFGSRKRDVFVTALCPTGSALVYSTYLGGSGDDEGYGITLGTDGKVFITGWTGVDFPLKNAYQAGSHNTFVTALTSTGSSLYYSTYLGGWSVDCGFKISLGTDDAAYIVGYATSPNFPVVNPYQAEIGGSADVFVSKLVLLPTPTPMPPIITLEAGDYDGDGNSDVAIFRPSSGLWAVNSLGRVYFGSEEDLPVSGDYDGDGYTDISIYRPATGLWAVKNLTRFYWGGSDDVPIPRDYDGDGTCDMAVFNSGVWSLRGVSTLFYGASGDLPIPEDYDGDGCAEPAVFRSSVGLWAIRNYSRFYFGKKGDIPIPGIYSWYGAGSRQSFWKYQAAVFRPSSGLWAVRGHTRYYFGTPGDIPITATYVRNPLADSAIFRAENGLWAVKGITRVYYGSSGDMPVTR